MTWLPNPARDHDWTCPPVPREVVDFHRSLAGYAPTRLVDLPAHYDFVLGVPGSLGASERALDFMIGSLPSGSTWTVAGVGRHQLSMAELGAAKGGNGRVGLEDNVFVSKGVLAKGNWELVAEAAKRARAKGREIATPQQAREILRLG